MSTAVSSTRINIIKEGETVGVDFFSSLESKEKITDSLCSEELPRGLPMFVSHCPGWVCFAEKTQPQAIPYMSTTKSAQQIIGSIIKIILNEGPIKKKPYIVSVQPCFDKKLEGSRKVRNILLLLLLIL
jgi:iron only hydrogenase large subunit-like protein